MRLIGAAFAALMAWQGQWSPVAVIDGDAVMRGLAPDAIPSIDAPVFVEGATTRELRDDELVIGVTNGRTTKAYSAWHLNSHEIVNDLLDGQPIAVTWCPLCFTAIKALGMALREALAETGAVFSTKGSVRLEIEV